MKILLNVLPPEKKEGLGRTFRYRFFLWQTSLIFLLELYYLVILGGIFAVLSYEVETAQEGLVAFDEYSTEAKKLVSYQDKFKEVNALTEDVLRYERLHLHWNSLFTLFESLVPEGVVIIELLTKDYTVSLSGQAPTREHFLKFEEALKGNECVSDVRVPISNLFTQTEVDFQIDFNIKKECLLRK